MSKTKPAVDDWEVRNDADTLQRAEEIKADKKRYSLAIKSMQEKADDIAKVLKVHSGLRR